MKKSTPYAQLDFKNAGLSFSEKVPSKKENLVFIIKEYFKQRSRGNWNKLLSLGNKRA